MKLNLSSADNYKNENVMRSNYFIIRKFPVPGDRKLLRANQFRLSQPQAAQILLSQMLMEIV